MIISCKKNLLAAFLAAAATGAVPGAIADIVCEVSQLNEWNSGYQMNVSVTNTGGSAVAGWEVSVNFSEPPQFNNGWSAEYSVTGNSVIASNVGYNGNLAPGQSTQFGFLGNSDGSLGAINCVGDGTAPPATPTPTPPPVVTPTPPPTTPTPPPTTPTPPPTEPGDGLFRVDGSGNITRAGEVYPVRCGNWFGLEGQHEPADAANNPDGAPMELFVGNMWWANGGQGTGRTIQSTMTEIKNLGINTVRFPIAPQTLDPTDPQGIGFAQSGGVLKNHESVRQQNARQALEDFIVLADQNDINVIVDIHSCSNYIGWRAGRLDAKPPYTDADRDNYDFKREGYSCAASGNPSSVTTIHAYDEAKWLNNLREIAGLPAQLGVDNLLGIDIFNEPWEYSWDEWKSLSENAYQAISEVNDDVLIFVEGVAGGDVPHGELSSNPNWGENLFPWGSDPMNIPKERLVLSPHTYGPSVYVQPQFIDPGQAGCDGLEGDEAGDADCGIVITPSVLRNGWEEHFGYLRDQGYAMVVGEFGGFFDWPATGPVRDRGRWDHITTRVDEEWQNALVDYMLDKNIEACYWSINPESGDTGGIYGHSYDPVSNESGWGQWTGLDSEKTSLLRRLWGM